LTQVSLVGAWIVHVVDVSDTTNTDATVLNTACWVDLKIKSVEFVAGSIYFVATNTTTSEDVLFEVSADAFDMII
jgi:hypothetical protein